MSVGSIERLSPVTGQLTVYTRHRVLLLTEGNTVVNGDKAVTDANTRFTTDAIDAFATTCSHVSTSVAGYAQVEVYVADAEATASLHPGSFELVVIAGLAIITVIKWALAAAITGALVYFVSEALHRQKMAEAYPSLYYTAKDPATGDVLGPWTREQVATWNAAKYPTCWVDPTTTMVVCPGDPTFEAKKEFIEKNTPANWAVPTEYPFNLNSLLTSIIIGAVAITGIYIAAKVLPGALKKKDT